jgi:hypothetical protein
MRTRSILRAALAAGLCLGTMSVAAPANAAEGVRSFVSNPKLKPAALIVNTSTRGQAPGFIFVANFQNKFIDAPLVGQGGPMILDNRGRLVWFRPVEAGTDSLNLQAHEYKGEPVLTWWAGHVGPTGEMTGTWFVANDRYRVIATLGSANGWDPSAHEIVITPAGTALVTAYRHVPHTNLTSVGGGEDGTLLDSGVLEYDIATGKLLREWSAAAHIPMEQSYSRTSPQNPNAYDPWHINSIDLDSAGNWLVSMRNTWAIHKIDGKTGEIQWTLGGKASTFEVGANAPFAFQHNARFMPGDRISMFDNECCALIPQPSGPPQAAPPVNGQSRGLVLQLDMAQKTATFVNQLTLYDLVAGTQGNMQTLANGNSLIGWGQQPFFSEHDKTGKLLLSIRFPDPDISYRAYRLAWKGRPTGRPSAAARRSGSRTRVYASWNGATQVAAWRVLGGPSSRKLAVLKSRVSRAGFETATTVRSKGPSFRVQALDSKGRVLGTSKVVRRPRGNTEGTTPAPVY